MKFSTHATPARRQSGNLDVIFAAGALAGIHSMTSTATLHGGATGWG